MMTHLLRIGMGLAALVLASATCHSEPRELFNGRDMSGWVVMYGGHWDVEDGVLIGRTGTNWTTNPEYSGSWLRTEKPYADFVLELEYTINERGNSGILFRSALEKNPSFTGYEMQINDDSGREPRKTGSGSIYALAAPAKNMAKPAGEWNKVHITCMGNRIQIILNGEKVVDTESDRSVRGYIGLQNHDSRSVVRFRNIKLQEL